MDVSRLLPVVLTAVALLLTGCSAPDHDKDAPMVSTHEAAHRSAAAKKARHAYVDPCSLLDPDQYAAVGGDLAYALPEAGLHPTAPLEFNNCAVPIQDHLSGAIAINYGYATTRRLALDDYLSNEEEYAEATVEKVDGIGDEAYFVSGRQDQAWVRKGEVTMYVSTMGDGFEREEAEQVLADMVAKAVPGMQEHPIHLPSACPAASSPRVVAAVGGKVTRALGSRRRSGTTCTYATARRNLALKARREGKDTVQNKIHVSDGLDTKASGRRILHLVAKSSTYLSPSEYGPYAWTYMFAPPAVISARVGHTERFGHLEGSSLSYDQAAFRSLNEWWVRRQADRLRK